jgi:N-methylhydantoinase B
MGALPFALESIAQEYEGDVEEGDVFILNDPYRGNNHPPDITIAKPVFNDGEVQFWSVSKGHHADVGGGGVVGYNPAARTVWEEGVRIPPAKLVAKGRRNKSLWDFILLNVRMPWLVEADLDCQIGACTMGERSLGALIRKYGLATLRGAADQILDASERQVRAALRAVPNGVFRAEGFIDHDGFDRSRQIALRLALTITDESVHFDWTESDPQVEGYVNSTLANTVSASFQPLFMTVCAGVKYNEGALRALSVDAREGSVLHAREPAPVTCCTVAASQVIIETTWKALAQAVPERVYAGWGHALTQATMGFNPRTQRPFGEIHFMAKPGAGATRGLDGWDHVGPSVTAGGLRAPDPELHELVDPYTLLRCEYWQDSAGGGQWRGGLGTVCRWRVEADGIKGVNFGGGVREQTRPYGLQSGQSAPASKMLIHRNGQTEEIDTQAFFSLNRGDEVEIFQTGGGGYGDPLARERSKVADDVADGLISAAEAQRVYGWNPAGRGA